MLRKILIGSLLFGLIGILIFGAVNRTLARVDTGDGIGRSRSGENRGEASSYFDKPDQSGNELGSDDLEENDCQGNGSGQGKRNVQAVAQGNGARQCNGSGNGQGDGQGNGQGNGISQGKGNGQNRGNGQGNGYRGGNKSDEIKTIEWLTLEGTIDSIDESSLVINTTNGESVEIANRAWRYAQDQGFFPNLGDQVTIQSFFDDYGSLEIASIEDLANGQSLTLRDESGRPMWAGR